MSAPPITTTLAPPRSLFSKLRFLGPGFILSASIVGSGELIATTILGAKGGFIAFWVIILSCLIKVALQLEFGKNAIISCKSLMGDFNGFDGLRIKKAHWMVWATFLLTVFKILQLGGMLGGSAIALSLLFPQLPVSVSAVLLGLTLPYFFVKNYYSIIEKAATWMVVAFTLFTLVSFVAVFFTPFSFGWSDVAEGLTFQLPTDLIFVAIGAFGITGVASDEIIAYTYWCREKGYARYVGEYENTPEWNARANGWIKVMHLDAFVAMAIYTLVTAAFYLLGAAILHGSKEIPEGTALITTLATIYTQSIGPGAEIGYLIGAFFALYSSLFATLAYWTRLFPDALVQIGWVKEAKVSLSVKLFAIAFPVCWIAAFLFVNQPGAMVLFGGAVGSVLLLLTVYGGFVFYRRNKILRLTPGLVYQLVFWASVISILLVSFYGITKLF
jgi:manganese transport protein